MPIFTPDFTKVDASIRIWEKGRYRVLVTGRTPFIREKSDDQGNVTNQVGIRYKLEMVGIYDQKGKLKGKTEDGEEIKGKNVSPFTCWMHSEGGWQFSKPFLMAACGYNVRNEENEANENLFQANDWNINGEPGAAEENIELGAGWDLPVDRLVDVTLSKSVDENPDGPDWINQEYSGWAPVEG